MAANAPQTFEGAQVWDLMKRCGHQLRTVSGMAGARVIGVDLNVVLALGAALRIDGWILAEMAPDIEAAMIRGMNQRDEE